MSEEIPFWKQVPDFSQPIWFSIEKKIGRHLTSEENAYIYYRGACYKEWLFWEIEDAATPQEVERLITRSQHFVVYQSPSLWKRLVDWILK